MRATPLWEIEKTGQAIHLEKIQDNWVVIRWAKYTAGKSVQFCCLGPHKVLCRKELKNLTQEIEDWEWHENRELESKVAKFSNEAKFPNQTYKGPLKPLCNEC